MKSPPAYGGQAVIEGVMMRGPEEWAVACRCPDNSITVEKRPVESVTKRFPFLKWPFIRGTVVLVESMVIGIKALTHSANQATGEEDQPISPLEMIGTVVFAIGLSIFLFIILPVVLAHLFTPVVQGTVGQNILEGGIRILVFIAYIWLVGLLKDIQRVFEYHGAEHKTINAYEAGSELTPAKVQQFSVQHPRCGTSFLLVVIVLKVFIFAFLATDPLWWRILSRILLLPLVAGIAYELIKFSARHDKTFFCRLLIAPGMLIQRLTTREPDDDQVEVAIRAFEAVKVSEHREGAPDAS
ncbi:MAG: DUF1385 domain-containing protein [Eubacteriales bacterium]|jgi:uncharacterized protein YqhQ|nr:DUF1385 domain-containing protein [Bacillota bacterium]MBV1727519.1 DUF1385 domain-containing protein [Desulforudis sp.]MDQ7789748.1 DUF1385 domain-containing protein [Clostridia bacterium]MDZ4043927.1 DUF1385 domain-containing protein [Eubacteriales bacterium]MBU4534177.1 DUF1385 domain-containing protein [Bacillota bacterium]